LVMPKNTVAAIAHTIPMAYSSRDPCMIEMTDSQAI
jgi:hypothetical protein